MRQRGSHKQFRHADGRRTTAPPAPAWRARRRIRFADTVGVMEPFGVRERIGRLRAHLDLEIEMHAHDDFGLATANTLAAVLAGATHVNTTVNGLGERAGNAALEEVVMGLKRLYGFPLEIDMREYPVLSRRVEQASGRSVGWQKSLVGEGVFTHEAGLHVDGLLKDPLNYQGVDPKELGRSHRLVLGKHSGSHAVQQAFAAAGIELSREQAAAVLPRLRAFVTWHKRAPAAAELEDLLAAAGGGGSGFRVAGSGLGKRGPATAIAGNAPQSALSFELETRNPKLETGEAAEAAGTGGPSR